MSSVLIRLHCLQLQLVVLGFTGHCLLSSRCGNREREETLSLSPFAKLRRRHFTYIILLLVYIFTSSKVLFILEAYFLKLTNGKWPEEESTALILLPCLQHRLVLVIFTGHCLTSESRGNQERRPLFSDTIWRCLN